MYSAASRGMSRPKRSKSAASRARIANRALNCRALLGWDGRAPGIVARLGGKPAIGGRGPQHAPDISLHRRDERRLRKTIARCRAGMEGRPVALGVGPEQ